jgi:hypothetical protein
MSETISSAAPPCPAAAETFGECCHASLDPNVSAVRFCHLTSFFEMIRYRMIRYRIANPNAF